jgi:spore coat polysaccharide biosynthesis protein SpsF
MDRKVIAIIQARMGSSRLPGKSLKTVGTWHLIDLVLHRVKKATLIDEVILATTVNSLDDVLEDHVRKLGYEVYRGSEEDVLSRFYLAGKDHNPDIVVRITGDCPFVSPSLIDSAIACYKRKDVDYLALCIGEEKPLAYPRGFDVELANFKSLGEAFTDATEEYEREHVMPYLYTRDNYTNFYIEPTDEHSRPNYRLCVDTEMDLEVIRRIYDYFKENLLSTEFQEIIEFLDRNPDIVGINQSVKQKHIKEVDERF